jgi:hypothetical protein
MRVAILALFLGQVPHVAPGAFHTTNITTPKTAEFEHGVRVLDLNLLVKAGTFALAARPN